MSAKKKKITVFYVVRKIFMAIGYAVLIGVALLLVLFKIEFNVKSYDIFLTFRIKAQYSYGIKHKGTLEVWKIIQEKESHRMEQRLFPS